MLRECYCICRNFSPKHLAFLVIAFSAVYLLLLRYTANSDVPYVKTGPSHHHLGELKVNVVRTLHILDEPDPKELENARQTLNFLNNIDVVESKQTPRTTLTPLPGGICPEAETVPDLWGSLPQAVLLIENLQEADVAAAHPEVKPGGEWSPSDCQARHRVAVIIPFRDRQSHLTRLLDFLIPVLQRQRLDFRFIVTEQAPALARSPPYNQYGNDLFNKGRIMNAAFRFAETLNVDCVIFHDVDMFPQDDRNPYSCPPAPRHMGAFVSNLGYQLVFSLCFAFIFR
ncbi:N-acetyllactosaminide 3-alpha-galactosyltransferase [Oesophagostomum dentatum]|uniref:N-acetyllactosaminide 3-alpha-galactosyltransferase n=1 Tax=Oesophagostomum dentatum TaxID=61180 RepID=A0A0B1TH18_OESDE|nr:N-acetyllactosaminide 3-alpha-galactosyltransferase [Oesophagostomum dentatum]